MGSPFTQRLSWSAPLAAGLALALVSCSGNGTTYYGGTASLPVTSVATADLNGDGKVDIVDTLYDANQMSSGWVSARIQNPSVPGTYDLPLTSDAGPNPGFLVAAPLTPGGYPGVVTANVLLGPANPSTAHVTVLYPDAAHDGGFLAPVTLATPNRMPRGVAVGDLNGDTWPDVVVAGDGPATLLLFTQAAPGQTFNPAVELPVNGSPTAVVVADLDGDGLLDIAAATSANVVSVLIQDKNNPGTFLPHVDYAVGSNPTALAVADLDGDHRPDLVVANSGTSATPTTQGLSILMNQAAAPGTFGAASTLDLGDAFAASVAVGDLNGDGRPDIAVACSGLPGDPGSVAVLLQDSTGAFQAPVRYAGQWGPSSVAIADIDGDGLPDLVLGDGWLYVRFQVPGQAGTFGPPQPFYQ